MTYSNFVHFHTYYIYNSQKQTPCNFLSKIDRFGGLGPTKLRRKNTAFSQKWFFENNFGPRAMHGHTEVFRSTLSYHRFCVPNWVCKRLKAFSHAEEMKSAGDLQSAVSLPVGPGQSPGRGQRGKTLGSSAYLGFENLLL